jgi:Domain of unknown function (DUF4845)
MNKQRGVGMLGVLMILVLLVAGAIIMLKAIPPYLEFFSIKKAFTALKAEAKGGSIKDIKDKFSARAIIDDIKSITANDLEISKEGGEMVVSANYQKVVPLFANLSLLIDFQASTQE